MSPNTTAGRLSPLEKGLSLIDKACRINFVVHARVRREVDDQIMRRALDAMSEAYLIRDLFAPASLASEGKAAKLPTLQPRKEMEAYFPAWAKGLRGRWRYIKFSLHKLCAAICHGVPPARTLMARPRLPAIRLSVFIVFLASQ